MSKKNIVIGAGISGAAIANLIAEKLGEQVLVIDRKEHIAGNCFDYKDQNGIMIHKYGSHIFHTNDEKVWSFVRQFTGFNQYMHKVIAVIDGIETTIPFNLNTIYDVFPISIAQKLEQKLLEKYPYNSKVPIMNFLKENDEDLKFLAQYIYEKVFLHYTTKQWGISPAEIDGAVTARVPVYISRDNRYFQDKYQGIPIEGYTKMCEKMLQHNNIKVSLNTDYKGVTEKFDRIFYTGSIDEFFDYEYGQLPYRSVNFEFETFDREFYQSNSVVNYPCNYDFTRIHEYKYYLKDNTSKTVIAKEYSQPYKKGKNDPYYPIENDENTSLYQKYLDKAQKMGNVYFLGRLGDYKYYDMDKAFKRAIQLFEDRVK